MYSLNAYGKMMTDRIRLEAYDRALKRAVEPGMIVLDIGTGAGIHALMAAQYGAGHVYAVEPADSIELAPSIARDNGLAEQITFIRDYSTRIELPERADLIVSDLHGTTPWYQHHIPTIVDARTRLLKEGGILIPQRDVVYAVPVEAPDLYDRYDDPWAKQPFGFDYSRVARQLKNVFLRGRVEKNAFLAEVMEVADLDYSRVQDTNASVQLCVNAEREGVLHGLMVWFDTTVFDDITLTSAPFEPEISYGSTFFPIAEPVDVKEGDSVRFDVRGALQTDYVWAWECEVTSRDGEQKARYRHNSLQGEIVSMDKLRKRAPSYTPKLSADAEIDRQILELMDGQRCLQEIARTLFAQSDGAIPDERAALEKVRRLSERYG